MTEKERILSERDFLIGNVLKAELMLSDWTLVDDEQEKNICLELLEQYISNLDYPKATFIFNQFLNTRDNKSRDVYIDILFDLITEIKAENDIEFDAWTKPNAEPLIAI